MTKRRNKKRGNGRKWDKASRKVVNTRIVSKKRKTGIIYLVIFFIIIVAIIGGYFYFKSDEQSNEGGGWKQQTIWGVVKMIKEFLIPKK